MEHSNEKQQKTMKFLSIISLILLVATLIVSFLALQQSYSTQATQSRELKEVRKLLKENGSGNGVSDIYTFEVYYAPSTKVADSMRADWKTNKETKLVFVKARGRVEAKEVAMNQQKIDEAQILHVVNPDGTDNDGWVPPIYRYNVQSNTNQQ
ncbi:hypothetical protein SAMN02745116_01271 [Pilibacter termitis]|uniref:Uncharacterized protein n=1 Tax=Pilibacter termitis TaxID=263852 RepID=A0A1T4N0C3_9ENTE|nr:hypothetical protein [Pilibacter termitis]SJZ72581.1 hypothetical protein SAMN02745116_01271 [Pilibacter termitis]